MCGCYRDVRLECLGLLRGLVATAKAAPERSELLGRSVEPILWRISESLLEQHAALGPAGDQQTAAAPGAGQLTSELVGLAEDLVLHATASLQTCLSTCQPFMSGWLLPSNALAASRPHVLRCACRVSAEGPPVLQCPALSASLRSWQSIGRGAAWQQTLCILRAGTKWLHAQRGWAPLMLQPAVLYCHE